MAEGTGLLNRNADSKNRVDDSTDADSRADEELRARRLRKDPDLAELNDVWVLLGQPIRAAIMALARSTPKG